MGITSSTDICNLALDHLAAGTVQDIENPTDPTEEVLERWYDHCRKRVLRSHPWNFALKRTVLAASATDPAFGYDQQFPVPADFLRIATINDSVYQTDVPAQSKLYKLEGNNILTSSLFSDNTALNLVYVCDFTNVSQMDPLFIDLLAIEIALSCAYKFTGSNTSVERVAELRKEARSLARAIDGQDSPPRIIERSNSRHVRRNNHSGSSSNRIVF